MNSFHFQPHDGYRFVSWDLVSQDFLWTLHQAMSSSSSSPTLQIAKGMDQDVASPVFPSLYPACLAMDRGAVCIPSPYADNGHADSYFCAPPVPENPGMVPPLSPSLYWSSHNTHAMPALSLHCPPAMSYGEPQIHTAWVDTKPHTTSRNRWRGRGLTRIKAHEFSSVKNVSFLLLYHAAV